MRSCRRLARTWVIMIIAFGTASIGYVVACAQHMLSSTFAPVVQIPRFLVGESASQLIGLFALGIIFLAFDIRARDVRDRVIGIIDTKPVSNLELVVGRLSGILMLLSIPLLMFLSLVLLHGAIADLAGWSFGAPIEIWSILSLLVWDVVPLLARWGGLIMLLAVILRSRVLVVLVAIGLLALNIWLETKLSWGQMEVAGAPMSVVVYPSDVAPVFSTGTVILNRVGWMLLATGLLVTAGALFPRTMARRGYFGLAGASSFGLGVLVLIGLFQMQAIDPDQKSAWLEIHQQQEISSFPDVEHLEGEVRIKPGSRVELNLLLTVSPPKQNSTKRVTFTLNPRYKVKRISIDTKEIDDYTFQDGLLTIPADRFGAGSAILAIEAAGKPDQRFAYLDEKIDLKSASVTDLSVAMARFLGNKSYIFRSDYVALLPGVAWYPKAGVAVGRDDLQQYPKDHFTIDVAVSVPKQWKVAGPGKSELQPGNKRHNTFRFQTENPVVDVVLIGSKFERVAMTVKDIEFELLYSAKHRKTFAAMELLIPQLKAWITDRLTVAEQYGLQYPYEALTLVEVPSHLRVLGGGWTMESTLYGPGVVMIRETGIPTSRFDVKFKNQDGEQSLQDLLTYVDNDLQSGNPLNGIARNFVSYQTSPVGRGAIALNYFIEDLVGDLLVERLPYHTTSTALNPLGAAGAQIQVVVGDEDVSVSGGFETRGSQNPRTQSATMGTRSRNIHNINSWSKIEDSSLSDLNFHEEPILSYDAVLLRNTYAISALKEWVDEEVLGNILRELLQNYRGLNFSYEDFRKIAISHVPRFEDITQNWLNTNRLPGYVVSEPSIEQFMTEDSDAQIFQSVFTLRNVESIPGIVKVAWTEEPPFGSNEQDAASGSLPFQLIEPDSAYQFAIKSDLKPTSITIAVPMSLNRQPIKLSIPSGDEIETSDSNSQPNVKPTQWNPIRSDQVVVDDLDPGFSISGEPKEQEIPWFIPDFIVEMGIALTGQSESMDRGLPTYNIWAVNNQWTRVQDSGFGRYRRTFAQVPSVSKNADDEDVFTAEFATSLPNSGTWELEYSVPGPLLAQQLIRGQVNRESESNDGKVSTPSDKIALSLTVQINDQMIPIELDLLELKSEVDADIGEIAINEENVSDRQISQLVRSLQEVQQTGDNFYWLNLGSYNIVDPHVIVRISNKNSVRDTFADAVRWTYLGNGD